MVSNMTTASLAKEHEVTKLDLLAVFVDDDLRPAMTRIEVEEAFSDFLGARNGQGFRRVLSEATSILTDPDDPQEAVEGLLHDHGMDNSAQLAADLLVVLRVAVDELWPEAH